MAIDEKGGEGGRRISTSALVGVSKDVIALLRDSMLFLFALLLLIFPSAFGSMLSNAGFEEGSFVGFKWKPKLENADASLKEARDTITNLKQQNDEMSKALAEARTKLADPDLKNRIARLEETNQLLNENTSKVEASVNNTIAANAQLVESVQNASDITTWGVVFGGDPVLKTAKYEIDVIAPKLGIPNAAIYLRQGSYRSVAVAETRSLATQILLKAKERRNDAYIVSMSKWCPKTADRDGYQECVAP